MMFSSRYKLQREALDKIIARQKQIPDLEIDKVSDDCWNYEKSFILLNNKV